MRGRFITFEGGEGSGKSTQARLLVERLTAAGVAAVATREPGGTPFAEAARDLLLDPARAPATALAETLLFYAARADHLAEVIRPALDTGRWVVSDRFSDSTRAYQGVARGLGLDVVGALDSLVVAETHPELTLLLDIEPEAGLARAGLRRTGGKGETGAGAAGAAAAPAPDTYEARQLDFHLRLRDGFLALARAEPRRFVVLDATLAPEAIAERVWAEVTARLGPL